VLALLGLFFAWLVYSRRQTKVEASDPLALRMKRLFRALYNGWYIDPAYQQVIVQPYYRLSHFLATTVDQVVIDGLVNGLGDLVRASASGLRRLQNGYVRTYVMFVLGGVVAMLTYLAFR
jgi:NADH-quinone oxidoreductase subunit L